jgi:hypothetical protein
MELSANAGTGIALWPNGIKALRAIGPDVEEEVVSRGCDISGMILGMMAGAYTRSRYSST